MFDTLSLIFREFDGGFYVAHAYRLSPRASTFVVECDAGTWNRAGFSTMNDENSRAYCARIFARDLHGHHLVSNKFAWASYATRLGRVSRAQLEQISPRFLTMYDRWIADNTSPAN